MHQFRSEPSLTLVGGFSFLIYEDTMTMLSLAHVTVVFIFTPPLKQKQQKNKKRCLFVQMHINMDLQVLLCFIMLSEHPETCKWKEWIHASHLRVGFWLWTEKRSTVFEMQRSQIKGFLKWNYLRLAEVSENFQAAFHTEI